MFEYIELIGGLILLLVAGDALVAGSISFAIRFKVSPLLIGLTIIAFGTSAPELFISLEAAFKKMPNIAVGNIIGSNIANILIVLGLPAIVYTMKANTIEVRKSIKVVLVASFIFSAFILTGLVTRWHGIILFISMLLYLYFEIKKSYFVYKKNNYEFNNTKEKPNVVYKSFFKTIILILFGIICLPIGAHFLIIGASKIAQYFGISNTIIGLSIIALGTSLPELSTVLSSVRRKESNLAIGNILGSNLFNMFVIMSLTAIIHPIQIAPRITNFILYNNMLGDIWIMMIITIVLLFIILFFKKINYLIGIIFTIFYIFYIFTVLY